MDLASIASIASAASSVFGSLFGRKPKARAEGVDYERLRREAEAAGFNPLTALMYGGAQAYTRTYGPSMSRMAGIAQAMGDFAQREYDRQIQDDRLALDRDYFGIERQRLDLEREAMGRQLAGVVHGPVFGPAATVAQPDGDWARHDLVRERYGALPAAMEGGGQYIIDAGRTIGGIAGDAMRALWSAMPASSPPPAPRKERVGTTSQIRPYVPGQ